MKHGPEHQIFNSRLISAGLTSLLFVMSFVHPAQARTEHQSPEPQQSSLLAWAKPIIDKLAGFFAPPKDIEPQGVTELRCYPVQPPEPFEIPHNAPIVQCDVITDPITQQAQLTFNLPYNQNPSNTIYAIAFKGTSILMLDGHVTGSVERGTWIDPKQTLLNDMQAVEAQDGGIYPFNVVIDGHVVTIKPTGDQIFLHYRIGPSPGNQETLTEYIVFKDGSEVLLHDLILQLQDSNNAVEWWDRLYEIVEIPKDRLAFFPLAPVLRQIEAQSGIKRTPIKSIPASPEDSESLSPPPDEAGDLPGLERVTSSPITSINVQVQSTKKVTIYRQNPADDPRDIDIPMYELMVSDFPISYREQDDQMAALKKDKPPWSLYGWWSGKGDFRDMITRREPLPPNFVLDSFTRKGGSVTINGQGDRGIFTSTMSKNALAKILLAPGSQINPESDSGSPNPVLSKIIFELLTSKEPFLKAHIVAGEFTPAVWNRGPAYVGNATNLVPEIPAYLSDAEFSQVYPIDKFGQANLINIPTGIPVIVSGAFFDAGRWWVMAEFNLPDGIPSPELADRIKQLRNTADYYKVSTPNGTVNMIIPVESIVPDHHSSKTP